jgi:ribosomal protein S18 acetylase RimI-like enzyme
MQQLSALHFQVHNLAVLTEMQGQGFGRRLLGHALGLAESKGGRVVDLFVGRSADEAMHGRALRILQRYGFVRFDVESGCIRMRFELTPE